MGHNDLHVATCSSCAKVYDAKLQCYLHAPKCPVLEEKAKRLEIKRLTANIRDVAHLRKIIMDVEPHLRRKVYNLIVPDIVHFIAPPFFSLVKPPGPRMKRLPKTVEVT